MKSKANTVETLKELLKNEKNKSQNLRNTVNQSYHEYQFYNLEYLKKDMLELLIHISEHASFESPLFQNILKNINKSGVTLLSTGQEILRSIKDEQFITFSHKQSYSQSLLFALILSKSQSINVDLVGQQKSLKGIGHLIADQNQADRLGFTKDAAKKEGVTFHNIADWNPHTWITTQSTIILDLFSLNPVQYRPFLLKYKTSLQKAKKVIIYHSHLQDQQVISQLIEIKAVVSDWFPLQLWNEHPLECIAEKDETQMFERLFVFLKEDGLRSQKQDVVIFKPADINVRRFGGKLSEQLSKHHLKEQANLITKVHQSQIRTKNNIFIVQNTSQLNEWDYDYRNLFYVLDYQTEATFRYNYELSVYVHSVGQCSGIEKAKRMSVVGSSRVGRYACLTSSINTNLHYIDSACQLSRYIIRMITSDISNQLEFNRKRIKQCLKSMQHLGIIRVSQNKVELLDQRIAQATREGVNPIEAKIIYNILDDTQLTQQQKTRTANLLIMAFVVFHSQGSLRQAKQQIQSAAHIKPNGIWRKSGYLQSCLEILTKYDLIDTRKSNENSKSETFRRKTSKFNEFQYDVFGSLFQIVQAKKKSFEDMDQEQFLRENIVNQDLFLQIRQEVFDFRDALGIQKANIILEKEDWNKIIQILLKSNKNSMALYSGSRRRGYAINNQLNSIFPDKSSLMSQLNQRPEFLLLIRLSQHENRYEILMSNSFLTELYLQITGSLPVRKSQSHSEVQIEFHGISNSTFQQLWKNNGSNIVKFQTQYNCYVEPNQEMAMIVIHSSKETADKIKAEFQNVLTKIKQKMSVSNKMVHYLGNTNLLLGAGGSVKQIIKSNYIDKCLLNNLHLEVTKEDLEQLFQQFFVLKKIQVKDPEPGKFYKSAEIHFNSQRDYYLFNDYFNECLFFDRLMDVKPIREERSSKFVKAKQYIEFKWFVWRSHLKALVRFANPQGVQKVIEAFKLQPKLDQSQVIVSAEGSNLFIQNLKPYTDQIFIEQAMKGYGQIKEVQILKTPLKQIMGNQIYLESLVKTAVQENNIDPVPALIYKMEPIEKCKNGLRICKVHIEDLNNMNKIANQLNKTIGKLGQGRLYAHTWFQTPILVPHRSMPLYQQVMAEVFKENQYPNIHSFIKEQHQKSYIILKCNIKPLFDVFHQKLIGSFQGYPIDLSEYQKSIILTEIGLANLLDLQEKYHCKLIVNEIAKSLHVLVAQDKLKSIKQQIKARVEDHFFYRLSLNSKTFKHMKTNSNILQQIKTNCTLRLVQLEIDSKALLLQGSAVNVQKAFNYLMHLIQSLTVPQQQMINADVCGICCCQPHRPYRLQKCSHKFCRACLLQYINSALGDNSLFPMKCPHCSIQIVIDDLECLLEAGQWGKVQIMATNQFVAKNAQIMTFCFTVGCKQINMIKSDHIECDVCLSLYCIECKMKYHPKITCEQAKVGGDQLFKKYMLQNGIRQCPNDKCKIPVVRIDGCYRVTCSRCNKSMCFKCDADKMKAYDDYNECYKHLNDVHGGYW